jgi:hypothetical protein
MSVDHPNYATVAKRVLKVGAEVVRQHVVKRRPPDSLAIKACIDALDEELVRLEKMADGYRAKFSASRVCEFPRPTTACGSLRSALSV